MILPDATTSPRWEANDRPSLKAAFDKAGIESDIQNAGGSKSKFGAICDGMINEGVQVLMIVNLDSDSGSACLKKAASAGVKSIDYDRLTLGGGASYYVSFDNVKVGELMGQGLQTCLDKEGKSKANIVYINGDPTDNNAALFKSGYVKALKPKIDSGDYNLVGDQSGFWDATKAGTTFEQLYTKNGGKIDGVVSANDTMAGGIVARLKANGLDGKVPVTGQDASVEGLQRILAGTQCMTVYKDTNVEAKAASDLAIALIKGDQAKADSLATGSVKDTVTGKDVPSVLATPAGDLPGRREEGHRRRLPVQGPGLHRRVRQALHEVRRAVSPPPTAVAPTDLVGRRHRAREPPADRLEQPPCRPSPPRTCGPRPRPSRC